MAARPGGELVSVIPALVLWRQEDQEFGAILSYIAS